VANDAHFLRWLSIFFISDVVFPEEMGTPAKLRIILEDDIRKLVLPSGIPSTLQDLSDIIQETFHIPRAFTLMYQDMDFDGQFFSLTSINDVQDKATLKLVMAQPIVLTFRTFRTFL